MSQTLIDDLDCLKKEFCDTADQIIPLMPTLLAMLDYGRVGDYKIVADRFKQGYYGKIENGEYIAPTTGPYNGFIKNVSSEEAAKFRRLMAGEETKKS